MVPYVSPPSRLPFSARAPNTDPWWNPAAEMQALDRTHRLGQHRTITAVRFVVAGECPAPALPPARLPARLRMHMRMHACTPTCPHAHALRAP